jgi:hypothetical protein
MDFITKAILEIGAEKLKLIRDKLGDDFSYDEIRLVRAKMSALL